MAAFFAIISQVSGRQATIVRVRRVASRSSMRPSAILPTMAVCLGTVAASAVPSDERRLSIPSIWSTATTVGPVSASSREMSRSTSCFGRAPGRNPHASRAASSTSPSRFK
jgi:hypothetical protein